MGALALLVLAAVALGVAVTSASPQGRPRWTYDTNNRYNGPGRWPGICDQHRSARQSPIDISLTGHKVRRVRPFQMDGFEDPANAIIDTSGTTVNVSLAQNEKKRKLSGGDLRGEYEFSQVHFHWGAFNIIGSEHMLSDEIFPIEMQLVHFNTKYGSNYSAAVEKGARANDTLAILSVLFRVTTWDNLGLEPIVKVLEQQNNNDGRNSNDNRQHRTEQLVLSNLLPSHTQNFYRYHGSLTTPPCSEFVLWSVFKMQAHVSRRQLNAFRETARHNRRMFNNFRRTKPFKRRRVVVEMITDTRPSSGSSGIEFLSSVLLSLALLLAN